MRSSKYTIRETRAIKKRIMKAKFTEFTQGENWCKGKAGVNLDFTFVAKSFDTGSDFGIDNGRVSKLEIKNQQGQTIVNYDRGWDIQPTVENQPVYDAVMKLLENAPARFDHE